MKLKLQQVYNGIPERIILMALESVDYSEDKAIAILNIVVEDDKKDDDLRKANADSPLSVSRDAHPRYGQSIGDCDPLITSLEPLFSKPKIRQHSSFACVL